MLTNGKFLAGVVVGVVAGHFGSRYMAKRKG